MWDREVEVIVQALAAVGLEESLMRHLVVPWLVGGASFHSREYVHQARMPATLGQDGLNTILLAKPLYLADEFDLQPVGRGDGFGIGANLVTQLFGPPGVIEDADVARLEVGRHAFGMAYPGQGALNNKPVKAGDDSFDLAGVTFEQRVHIDLPCGWRPRCATAPWRTTSARVRCELIVPGGGGGVIHELTGRARGVVGRAALPQKWPRGGERSIALPSVIQLVGNSGWRGSVGTRFSPLRSTPCFAHDNISPVPPRVTRRHYHACPHSHWRTSSPLEAHRLPQLSMGSCYTCLVPARPG